MCTRPVCWKVETQMKKTKTDLKGKKREREILYLWLKGSQ